MARKRRSRRSRRRAPSVWVVLGVLGFLLLGYLVQEDIINIPGIDRLEDLEDLAGVDLPDILPGGDPSTPVPVELSEGSIQAYFTTPALIYPDRPAQRTPPPHEQAVVADIDAAQRSIDMVVFEYNLPGLLDALVRAQQRGVAVRLALDEENLEKEEMAFWAGEIERAGIPVAWETSTAFLHSKFIIIDDTVVWMGSWNATVNDTYRNNNTLLRFTIPAIVANYRAEFAQMFAGQFGADKAEVAPNPVIMADTVRIANYFAPQGQTDVQIVERLNAAEQSIRFLAFSYTSDPIGEAMRAQHAAGVRVEGVFERRNATGQGSEYEPLLEAGADVLVDGNCYTMHHKLILIDERTVITGSYNFSRRAEETNDENLVIIDDPGLAAQYLAEYERVRAQAENPTECG